MRTFIENKERADMDIIVDSFIHDLNIYEMTSMPIITIYNNITKDYPGKFVARLFMIEPGEIKYTRYIMLSDDLSKIWKEIPPNMTRMLPHPKDDPVVLETWL